MPANGTTASAPATLPPPPPSIVGQRGVSISGPDTIVNRALAATVAIERRSAADVYGQPVSPQPSAAGSGRPPPLVALPVPPKLSYVDRLKARGDAETARADAAEVARNHAKADAIRVRLKQHKREQRILTGSLLALAAGVGLIGMALNSLYPQALDHVKAFFASLR